MELLHALAKLITSPIVQFFLFITIGVVIKLSRPQNHFANLLFKGFGIFATLWLLLCSQSSFSNWLIAPLEQHTPVVNIEDERLGKMDQILVLACYHVSQKQLPEVSRWPSCAMQRLVQAKLLNKQWHLPIVLTGGNFLSDKSVNYASEAATLLMLTGVEEEKIKTVSTGVNTITELNSALTDKNKSTIIISSASHMKRIEHYLKRLDIKTYILVPVDHLQRERPTFSLDLPRLSSLARAERAIYEYFALAELALSNNTSLKTNSHY
ncbi:MAG: YdcF family protein [Pseudomonadota bacterium]|nr:YdcF family protein [Pseudomonadota bacterium]